jgi:hypothetical protein
MQLAYSQRVYTAKSNLVYAWSYTLFVCVCVFPCVRAEAVHAETVLQYCAEKFGEQNSAVF